VFWPPHPGVETLPSFFDPIPTAEYFSGKGLSTPRTNSISFVSGLLVGTERIYSKEEMVSRGTLSLTFVTNEAGEPVEFPPNDRGLNPLDSFGDFIPNIPYSMLNVSEDVSSLCSFASYFQLENLVGDEVAQILNSSSLFELVPHQVLIPFSRSSLPFSFSSHFSHSPHFPPLTFPTFLH
jgi:hypothetical protein